MAESKRKKVGEILVSAGYITFEQLAKGLTEHHSAGQSLGSVLVKLGFITEETLYDVLTRQVENTQKKRVGEILVSYGFITTDELKTALEKQKTEKIPLGKVLEQLELIDEEKLLDVLSAQLDLSHVVLEGYNFKSDVLELIPEELAKTYKAIPLFKQGHTLAIAFADPTNTRAIDHLRYKSGMDIEPMIATEKSILDAIKRNYSTKEKEPEIVPDEIPAETVLSFDDEPQESVILKSEEPKEKVKKQEIITAPEPETILKPEEHKEPKKKTLEIKTIRKSETIDLLTDKEEAQVRSALTSIVNDAAIEGATGIHLEPTGTGIRVRFRVNGRLKEKTPLAIMLYDSLVVRLKAMTGILPTDKIKPTEGSFRMRLEGHKLDLKISFFPCVDAKNNIVENIVIKLIRPEAGFVELEKLGMSGAILKNFTNLIGRKEGIILIAGQPSSGRTTTLYSALKYLLNPDKSIFSVEENIEQIIDGVRQSRTDYDAGINYSEIINSVLKQDPDVIAIGEIKDAQTFNAAQGAYRAGKIVISTITANSSINAISKLLNMGVSPLSISVSLIGVLAQGVVRKICTDCKESYSPTTELSKYLGVTDKTLFYTGKGCERCSQTGYVGKTGIFELLLLDNKIKSMIMSGADVADISLYAQENGLTPLISDGLIRVKEGATTLEQVLSALQ